MRINTLLHREDTHRIVQIPLKTPGAIPGDASAEQMRAIAELGRKYSYDEIRVTHTQNLVLPHVHVSYLPLIWRRLRQIGLASANAGLVTDIIACPGLDFCSLATARSIPVAQRIAKRLEDPELQEELGQVRINISGCINACGHHHVGHIGILGLDKGGEESYQVTLGGSSTETPSIGKIIGPAFSAEQIEDVIEAIIMCWRDQRKPGESFPETLARTGIQPYKERVYASAR